MLKQQKLELIVWTVGIGFLIFVFFTFSYAEALTRDERSSMKEDLRTALEDKKNLDIQEKRNTITEAEENIDLKKQELKDLKKESSSSWEAVKLLDGAEIAILEAKKLLQLAKQELIEILQLESGFLTIIKELTSILNKDDSQDTVINVNNTGLAKKLGITLSKTCIIMITNNFTTTCPSYQDLLVLDNSIYEFSGEFVTDKNGFFHRGDPPVGNSWRLYDFDDTPRMFVDPPVGMTTRVKLITIVPNFDNFFILGDNVQHQTFEMVEKTITITYGDQIKEKTFMIRNQTQEWGRIIYHDRYVENCDSAYINAEDWKFILVDTINYIRNGCDPAFTEFINKEIIIPELTEIDITTSPNWQYSQWLKDIKKNCKILC